MADRTPMLERGLAEFVIIVAGVLSAFYVEEFREGRREAALEREYASRLVTDLDDALANLEFGQELVQDRSEAGRLLLKAIGEVRASDPWAVVSAAFEITFVPVSSERRLGRRATYDELVSTGNLSTFQDPDLRDSLARYYEEYRRIAARLEMWPEEWRTWVSRQLHPDLDVGSIRDCWKRTEVRACAGELDEAQVLPFVESLRRDSDEARGDINRMVLYQDRQLADLAGFTVRTREMRSTLVDSGLVDR